MSHSNLIVESGRLILRKKVFFQDITHRFPSFAEYQTYHRVKCALFPSQSTTGKSPLIADVLFVQSKGKNRELLEKIIYSTKAINPQLQPPAQ